MAKFSVSDKVLYYTNGYKSTPPYTSAADGMAYKVTNVNPITDPAVGQTYKIEHFDPETGVIDGIPHQDKAPEGYIQALA